MVRFDLENLLDNPGVLELLSKEAIRSGKSDEIASQVAQTNEIIDRLTDEERKVAQAVSDALESEAGEFPLDLEEQSREFVQHLVSVLREQRQFVNEQSPTGSIDEEIDDTPDEPEPLKNRVAGKLARRDITGDSDTRVAVFPTKKSGLTFLQENEAWGFVRVGSEFDYVAMYVTEDVQEVRYIAKVKSVVEPEEADLMRDPLDYKDSAKIDEGKMVIEFESGSLHELEDPVPYESKYPQGLRYTTLGKLRNARTTDDML